MGSAGAERRGPHLRRYRQTPPPDRRAVGRRIRVGWVDAARDAQRRVELPARAEGVEEEERVEEEGAGFFTTRDGAGAPMAPGRGRDEAPAPADRRASERRTVVAARKGRDAAARPRTRSPRAASRLPSLSTPLPRWELRIWGEGRRPPMGSEGRSKARPSSKPRAR
jgi:hypothetical protein